MLTETHRLAQARLGAETVRQMFAAFPLLRVGDLDGSFEPWLDVVTSLINGNRRKSSELTAGYLSAYRKSKLGPIPPFPAVIAGAVNAEALTTSMAVTGPVTISRLLATGARPTQALETALVRTSAAAQRHVLNGGRETATNTLKADPEAVGYYRKTSGKACDFCQMLAGRGAVYLSEDTAGFKCHDSCHCTPEPLYR